LKRDDFGDFQYDDKGDPNGQKARLVADGNRQRAGVDYHESYAPTARQESLRFVLAIGSRPGMHLSQGDVKAAFLNSPMTEEVYLKIPVSNDEQMEKDRSEGLVWRLHKAVYGLVQAARAWSKWLQQLLEKIGFKRLSGDWGVYYLKRGKEEIFLPTHVDNLIAAHTSMDLWNEVIEQLKEDITFSTLGPLNYQLGMNIIQRPDGSVFVHQATYIKDLLRAHGMESCKSVRTPAVHGRSFTKEGSPLVSTTKHECLVLCGKLSWLESSTRPDISFAVRSLQHFMADPKEEHWIALKRVVHYLAGTIDLGLLYKSEDTNEGLQAFSDSDWAACPDTRKSTTGCVLLFNGAIEWLSQ
jgi:hypothetical protein